VEKHWRNAVAFGRDGCELELNVFNLQKRAYETALRRIARKSKHPAVIQIAKEALIEGQRLSERLTE